MPIRSRSAIHAKDCRFTPQPGGNPYFAAVTLAESLQFVPAPPQTLQLFSKDSLSLGLRRLPNPHPVCLGPACALTCASNSWRNSSLLLLPMIEPVRVNPQQPLHPIDEVAPRCLGHKVKVIAY